MGKWDYQDAKGIRNMMDEIAIGIIQKIDRNKNGLFSREERCMKISGVLAMLDGVCEDMYEDERKTAMESEEFSRSCVEAKKAFDNLFDAKTWKTEVRKDGTAT